jgi:hypothetical protein
VVTVPAPPDPVANHVARDASGTTSPPMTRDAMSPAAGPSTTVLTRHPPFTWTSFTALAELALPAPLRVLTAAVVGG